MTSGPRWTRDQSEFDRAIGFVDATFAFALTLLATTLDIGDVRRVWDSTQALGAEINPQLIAFLISFAVISSYWLAHHRMIAAFTAIDTPVIVANLALIATIVVLPFATEAVGSPNIDDLPLPTAVLAVNVAAASGVNTLVYVLGAKRGLIDPEPSRTAFTADVVPRPPARRGVPGLDPHRLRDHARDRAPVLDRVPAHRVADPPLGGPPARRVGRFRPRRARR